MDEVKELKVKVNLSLSSKDERYTCIVFNITFKNGGGITHPLVYDNIDERLYNYCSADRQYNQLARKFTTNNDSELSIIPGFPILAPEIRQWWDSLEDKSKEIQKLRIESMI